MDLLEVKELSKQFKSKKAVDSISFSLKEGEILGLLGPNGAGKTTTIQMLMGALTPTSGEVHYFGKSLFKHREEILEQVNFSTTYTNLPWILTVRENLTYFSHLYKIKNRKKRINEIVEIFKLEELVNKRITQLSAGQRTRVNLAKAFINFPKVLLLDEPTASLDPDIAKYIRDFLLKERKEFQVSIIFTSHNMREVEDVCDRVIFINEGKLVANDTPQKLAKTIQISHVELLVANGLKKLINHCEEKSLKHGIEGRFIVIDVNEKEIPQFLKVLSDKKIEYDEISIQKPTLEDYFLQKAGRFKV